MPPVPDQSQLKRAPCIMPWYIGTSPSPAGDASCNFELPNLPVHLHTIIDYSLLAVRVGMMLLRLLLLVPTTVVGIKATAATGRASNGHQRSWVQILRRCVCVSVDDIVYHPPMAQFSIFNNNRFSAKQSATQLVKAVHTRFRKGISKAVGRDLSEAPSGPLYIFFLGRHGAPYYM